MEKLAVIRKQRAAAHDSLMALAELDSLTAEQTKSFADAEAQIKSFDEQIGRIEKARALALGGAQPAQGQEDSVALRQQLLPAQAKALVPYTDDHAAQALGLRTSKGLCIAGVAKMIGLAGGSLYEARRYATDIYGEQHPVTKALLTSTGSAGGFLVPPDQMNEIIELLRPETVVRSSNPRVIPMPRGTMTLPGQNSPATASYTADGAQITSSQQGFDQIVASFKKLTALVPVSNDMMRYADPAVDAIVRDDLVEVLALREDLAFMFGDGTVNTPRGWLSFANQWAVQQGGTAGFWSTTGNSTLAANGTAGSPLQGLNGGCFVTSTESYTLATAASELGGLVNKLDSANVRARNRVWFMNPRPYNYLYNVQNSLGVYVYRDELSKGTLLGYPVKRSTQIGINYYDTNGSYTAGTFIFLAEMPESMILDSMQLELAVSREGTYLDATGTTQSAFQKDLTLIRAIAEHDFQMRHISGVAVLQNCQWAPAIS